MYAQDKLYRCFDPKLKWYLLDRGCRFLLLAKDAKSLDTFWLFERNDLFEKLYKEFKEKDYGEIVYGKNDDYGRIQGKNEQN